MIKKILILILGLILIGGCIREIQPELYCEKDSDCVPAQCCHPTSVINKEFTPDCTGIFCTLECREDTLDCGYGSPACIKNKCIIIWTKK